MIYARTWYLARTYAFWKFLVHFREEYVKSINWPKVNSWSTIIFECQSVENQILEVESTRIFQRIDQEIKKSKFCLKIQTESIIVNFEGQCQKLTLWLIIGGFPNQPRRFLMSLCKQWPHHLIILLEKGHLSLQYLSIVLSYLTVHSPFILLGFLANYLLIPHLVFSSTIT